MNRSSELFDDWPEKYDQWFQTPIGKLVKACEAELLRDLLRPAEDDLLLDVGCGTGIFTYDILAVGSRIVGMDISAPMLAAAADRFRTRNFAALAGDMRNLPFRDGSFDKVYSMTAIEFVADAARPVAELDRVTRTGGTVVLTTLNRLSPWADTRLKKAKEGHELFQSIHFRTPEEIRRLVPGEADVRTAIHFSKEDDPVQARRKEAQGCAEGRETGAFLAVRWTKT